MDINEILTFNTQILFILLSIIAIFDYLRHGSPPRRDFALMASSLGIPLGITFVRSIHPIKSSFLDIAGAFTLFSQPYFLFRLLQYFYPSRHHVGKIVLGGFFLCCALLWYRMAASPILTITLIFSYCAVVEAYCTLGFYQGTQGTTGTLRRRLWIITVSSSVFTLAFIINVIKAQFPTLTPSVTPIAQTAAAISAFFFYVAFTPPRWLRRAWQMEELRNYLLETRNAPGGDTFVTDNLARLSQGARGATSGAASGVLNQDQSTQTWTITTATSPDLFARLLQNGQPLLQRDWQKRQAVSYYVPEIPDPGERRQLRALGVQTWLLVPVRNEERHWGLLIVALRDRSLFIDDDLNMLGLLAQECALILNNHRLIDELQHYSSELEQKVEERTAALQRSNEELRRYAYIASHDLQEPLRMVTSYLQLIEQRFADKLDDEGREFMAFAVEGALRMKHLISDLLTYSRVENRTRRFTTVDMGEVLDKTRKFLSVAITETAARLTSDPLPRIIADEDLMFQILQNLIGNAIKYRNTSPPEIHVSAACKDQEWVFSVRDNGIGIEKQYLDRIFIIFQRLHPHQKYPGTGIGLAICKKATELHDGRIWAESHPGTGTTFYFTIPVRDSISESEMIREHEARTA